MTPPRTAGHAAHGSIVLSPKPAVRSTVARPLARLIDSLGWAKLLFLLDLIVLCAASTAALLASPIISGAGSRWLAAGFPLVVLVLLHTRTSPDERHSGSTIDTAAHVLGVISLTAMLTIALDTFVRGPHPVGLAVRLWLFSLVYVTLARVMMLHLRRYAVRSEAFATPTLIVGAGKVGEHVVKRLAADHRYGLRPVGFLDSNPLVTSLESASVPVLGGPQALSEAIQRTGARHVILAFTSDPDRVHVETVRRCHELGVEVSMVPRLYESISERATIDHIGGLPLLALKPINPKGWQFAVKHVVDRVFAAIALTLLAPLLLAIAIAVRLSSPGPALFRQRRVGRDGHEFDIVKFRTMRKPRSKQSFEVPVGCAPGGIEGEDRRTVIGALLRASSLDELPQLVNVLRGDMSLVGPRPERPEFVELFSSEVDRYEDRHRVKSGITGWAQVNGLRGQTSIADRVEWDNYYIRNWSLRLDLRIVAMTVGEVLRFRDSFQARRSRSAAARRDAAAEISRGG
jgi:exopolysaccharide biosynthesis polyprenyl glycosylphosphotransferase